MGLGNEYFTGNGFDLVENDSPRRSGRSRLEKDQEQVANARRYETELTDNKGEDRDVDIRSERLMHRPKTQQELEDQEVRSGRLVGMNRTTKPKREISFTCQKALGYDSGMIYITTEDLKLNGCHTFGYEVNKFDSTKGGSVSLCLDPNMLKDFKVIVEECLGCLSHNGIFDHEFKSGLYGKKIYVKAGGEFEGVEKNTKVNATVRVKGIYISNRNTAHLQLHLVGVS